VFPKSSFIILAYFQCSNTMYAGSIKINYYFINVFNRWSWNTPTTLSVTRSCIHNVLGEFQNLFLMVSLLSSAACCSSHNVNAWMLQCFCYLFRTEHRESASVPGSQCTLLWTYSCSPHRSSIEEKVVRSKEIDIIPGRPNKTTVRMSGSQLTSWKPSVLRSFIASDKQKGN